MFILSSLAGNLYPVIFLAARSHTQRDKYFDVHTYSPLGEQVFLETDNPKARIASTDILTIFPASDNIHTPTHGILELPQQAFYEFKELSARHQQKCETLWALWTTTHRGSKLLNHQ